MKILHICNDYLGSAVHSQLNNHIIKNENNVDIFVYIGLNYKNRNKADNISEYIKDHINVMYSIILKPHHRFLYKSKIHTLLSDIEKRVTNITDISIISASTLCADGAVAYELFKKYSIPYVVSVRDTDINTYFKYLKHYKGYFYNILKNASKIIFISEQYKITFLSEICPKNISSILSSKSVSIPNGIDNLFLNYINIKNKLDVNNIKIVYTGGIIKRKNIVRVVNAVNNLRTKGYKVEFTAVGKGFKPNEEDKYSKQVSLLAQKHEWFHLEDRIDKSEMIDKFKHYDIYIMASHTETFGLVYVEALTQGLPIIYSRGQGFDNVYSNGYVGYSVNSRDITDIENQIVNTINNYTTLTDNIQNESFIRFDWNSVAQVYYDIYNAVTLYN